MLSATFDTYAVACVQIYTSTLPFLALHVLYGTLFSVKLGAPIQSVYHCRMKPPRVSNRPHTYRAKR